MNPGALRVCLKVSKEAARLAPPGIEIPGGSGVAVAYL
jgi:hypothetical protein